MRNSRHTNIKRDLYEWQYLPPEAIYSTTLNEAISETINSCAYHHPHKDWDKLRCFDWQKHSDDLFRKLKDAFKSIRFDPIIDDVRVCIRSYPFRMSIVGLRGWLNGRGPKIYRPAKNILPVYKTSLPKRLEVITQATPESLGIYAELPLQLVLLLFTMDKLCQEHPHLICYTSDTVRAVNVSVDSEVRAAGYISNSEYKIERCGFQVRSLYGEKLLSCDNDKLSVAKNITVDETSAHSGNIRIIYATDENGKTHSFVLTSPAADFENGGYQPGRFYYDGTLIPIRSELEIEALETLTGAPISNRFGCAYECRKAIRRFYDIVTSDEYIDTHRRFALPFAQSTLYLDSLGPNRVKVMAYLRKLFSFSYQQIKEL